MPNQDLQKRESLNHEYMSDEQVNKTKATDEVDLIELFNRMGRGIKRGTVWLFKQVENLFILLIRKSLWIVSFAIIGLLVGYLIYKSSPRYYSSEMTAISNSVDNSHIVNSINLLNSLFKEKNYSSASAYLDIPVGKAKQIKSIAAFYGIDLNRDKIVDYVDYANSFRFNPKDTMAKRLTNYFFVNLEVYNEGAFTAAREGLKKYIYKNEFVVENNNERIAQNEEMIKVINIEIKKIDSLQKIAYFETPLLQKASNGQMVFLNEKEVKLYHDQLLKLQRDKMRLERENKINKDPITIVQDFTPLSKAENPYSKYGVKWGLIFAVIGFIASLLWQFRTKIVDYIKVKHY